MNLKKLSLLSLLCLSLSAFAGNTKTTVQQVTDGVSITSDVDYIITDASPFATSGSVDIQNTEHAVVIIKKIRPSVVIKSWLKNHVFINGVQAENDVNCQVRMYDRGAIIYPYASDIKPLTCYTEAEFSGESCNNYSEGSVGGYMKTLTATNLNNKIKSFKLKRGYMVTFALGTAGWGYSRVFVADHEDLEFNLPANMAGRVSSYRLFKWWNVHKATVASTGDYNTVVACGGAWCYDWAQGNANNLPDIEWVPNHIYEDYPSSATCGSVTGSCNMKTNNEPGNSSDDHPQDVATVLNNWQNLMRTGMRLCSESSHDGSWSHLRAFIDSIDARGWRCDMLDLHCYWGTSSFGDFSNYYNNYGGRPIWISEWVWGASWNASNWSSGGIFAQAPDGKDSYSTANQQCCYNGTVPILEKLNASKYVERYAYWNGEAAASKIYKDGSLSLLGKYFANMDEGLGYNADLQKIPTVVTLVPTNLTGTYTKSKGSFTLTWNDQNGDMVDSVVVQIKAPGATTFKWLANIPLKDMNAKALTYTYTDYPEAGANYYRVAVYPIGNKNPIYSGETSVTVSSSKGTNMYQYGKLAVTNTDAITTDFSESFSSTPAIFMGVMTNKNSKLYPTNLIKSVSKTKFSYTLVPWTMGSGYTTSVSTQEEIPFLALQDTTNYKFGDLDCEVGNAKINTKDTLTVTFRQAFPEGVKPVVITELRCSSSPSNGLTIRIFDVTNTGFKAISMYEESVNKKNALQQTLCYLAITPGMGELDADNSIIIAAGHGSNLYGSVYRESYFMDNTDSLVFKNPYIFGTLQTLNYPGATILRKQSDITVTDTSSPLYKCTTGGRIKRQFDATCSSSVKPTATTSGDELGWLIIANWAEGCSAPTAIHNISKTYSDNNKLNISVKNRQINVANATNYEIYSTTGAKVSKSSTLTPGVYVVKTPNKSTKVIVK